MEKREIVYEHQGVKLHGLACFPEGDATRPAVLVSHDWSGRNAMAERVAGELAGHGYVGFALDMYGEGRVGRTTEERAALMSAVRADRSVAMGRIQAAVQAVRELPRVDPKRVGALGFCFGGACVLDLARSGADVSGVVSLHGLLEAPPPALRKPITARVLVLHGYRDPMAKPAQVLEFADEMAAAGARWELHAYGNSVHAFANPDANAPAMGTVYDAEVARRAFRSMYDFFGDVFQ
jgi:dienelactone hydrolase